MNIFYLDSDPKVAAEYHVDKHVVKMILETAQLLCTAHRILDPEIEQSELLYKATHKNHPSAVWVRQSNNNYNWLYCLFVALCDEYTYRYNKIHLTDKKLRKILSIPPRNIPIGHFTPPTPAMPDEYKQADVVKAYREYYQHDKVHLAAWKKREVPEWFQTI